ncbi:MAG TPA: pitrilysin family protein [candidate division Zixibacteria bacterium]|nr:pitrilysin family protein [candidate division Zixibacteria bacterium]
MNDKGVTVILKTALICIFSLVLISPDSSATTAVTHRLANGMELILQENHSSDMVASVVFVKSGSKYESRFENGITHFLEHLLFDGTINQTREQLDKGIRNLGGYINAFTAKDLTAYLVLLPGQHIKYGLTVQADMLFNSNFPEAEMAKERKVVIEEIKRDKDSPGYAADAFFTEKAYGGTDYARPVLGYEAFIENIPRAAVIDYWKRFYEPKNMVALIVGDFVADSMIAMAEAVFGPAPNQPEQPPTESGIQDFIESRNNPSNGLEAHEMSSSGKILDTVANVTETHIGVSINLPEPGHRDYLALDLLSQYLSMDGVSPLKKALLESDPPLATEVSVGLTPYAEFSRLEISVLTDKPDKSEVIVKTILAKLADMMTFQADAETVEGIKVSVKCDRIYNAERLHYYAFMISPLMMSAGWDFIDSYADRLAEVTWQQSQEAAGRWLQWPDYVATVVRPSTDSGQILYEPIEMSETEVVAYFDTVQIPVYDLTQGVPLEFPSTDSVELTYIDQADYRSGVLDNGLQYIIKSSPDSRVFAVNILGKNRTLREPEGLEGITDFVNRCLEKGTVTRTEEELSRDLAKIGARVSLYDNPWIPFDDHYTNRRYSFAKFETIDEFASRGFHLFAEIMQRPAFDSAAVESVRRSMLAILGRKAGSPGYLAGQQFISSLLGDQPYARPVAGTPQSIAAVTRESLIEHHRMFYSPGNMILTIACNQPADEVLNWIEGTFGRLAADSLSSLPQVEIESFLEVRNTHQQMESDQISILLGSPLPGIMDPDVAAIKVATTLLSERLFGSLREKQGLAYSVGASSYFDRDFGWTYCSIGTGSDNYDKAVEGIILQIEKLKLDGPTAEELATARNQIMGRMSSSRLARINQAYYLAENAYLGLGLGYDKAYLTAVSQVSIDSIRRAMARWFRTDAYILSSAGNRPENKQ